MCHKTLCYLKIASLKFNLFLNSDHSGHLHGHLHADTEDLEIGLKHARFPFYLFIKLLSLYNNITPILHVP